MYTSIVFRRPLGILLLLSAFFVVTSLAQAQVVRPFDERAGFNVRGDIEMVGNVLLTCAPGGNPDCADVQAGNSSGHNGNRNMLYVNVDPGAGFDNSSSADLNLPAGATVLYAGLYWGGRADPSDPDRGVIQLREAGAAGYQTINADELDTITNEGDPSRRPYLATTDVTAIVQTAGNGTYFVGDITASDGSGDSLGLYGGWSMIVLYEDVNEPFRRLSLFDGAAVINTSNNVQVTVSGLLTPQTGAFDTFMGAMVWEGDFDFTGDQFILDGNLISDALNPGNNFWNSSMTRLGTRFSAKNPDFVNQMAIDLDYSDASGILGNGATEAQLEFTTDQDVYFPHALTFAVDLFVPDLVSSFEKTAVDLNGGDLMPGDTIEYTITYENTGQDGATVVVLTDPIPNFTDYVPGSLEVLSNAGTGPVGPQTDVAGDDVAEFDGGNNRAVFRLGDGADQNEGGLVLPGEVVSVSFQVQVHDDVTVSGETIVNTATIEYGSQSIPGMEFDGDTGVEITVVELADLVVVKSVDEPAPLIGDNATFTITVTNDGPADATGVEVIDQLPSGYDFVSATPSQGGYDDGAGVWTVGALNMGDSATLQIEATVLETGDYLNTASVSGDQEDPDEENNEDEEEPDPVAAPALTLVKAADPTSYGGVGANIEYSFTVENTGNVTLFDVEVNDPLLGGIVACTPDTLAPTETADCGPVDYIVTQQDVDNGSVVNNATATAVDADDTPVEDDDELEVDGPAHTPAMTTVKEVTDMPDPVAAGAEIEYTITVTNTGNVTLDPVDINDDLITPDSVTCNNVAPGGTCVLIGTYVLEQENIDDGIIVNTATGTGTPPVGDPIEEESKVSVPLPREPALELVKSADPDGYTQVDDVIDYSFTVENTGNVTLFDVAVDDPMLGGAVACTPESIAPGEIATCGPVSYTVTQQDVDNGSIVNNAAATAVDPDDTPAEDDDELEVTGPAHAPALEVAKTLTDAPDPIVAGSILEYTVTATNTGNVTLDPVEVQDTLITPSDLTCNNVAPGDTCVLTGTYEVTQQDINDGQVDNTGSAIGTPPSTPQNPDPDPVEDEDQVTTPLEGDAALELVKSADPASYVEAGDTIDYVFTVENIGGVTLTGVSVDDPLLGGAVTCAPTTLDPGDTATCGPVSYVVTQQDVDDGEIINAATATALDPDQTPVEDGDELTVPGPDPDPVLGLVKESELIDDNGNDFADPGEVIEYTLTATNDGNVTLSEVTIDDPLIGALDCTPTQPAVLEPGEMLVCTGNYTVTEADVDDGAPVVNTATAAGTGPNDEGVEDEDGTSTPVTPMPALELVKEAELLNDDGNGTADAGEVIEYTLTATNIGNVLLESVEIDDPMLDALDCAPEQPATLDLDESLVCTGSYTVTQADVDAGGMIANTATASAPDPTDPNCDDPDHPDCTPIEEEAEEEVPVTEPAPALMLVKSADPMSYAQAGDVVNYAFTVENTGNVTLTGVMVDDPLLGGTVACAPDTLAPDENASCGPVAYVVTTDDVDAGSIVNAATGMGTPPATPDDPDPAPVTGEDGVTVSGPAGAPALEVVKVLSDAPDPIEVGSVLSYTVTATNTGNVTLTDVVVEDTLITPASIACATLAVGADCVLEGTYTVTQTDVDNGQVVNLGTGTGNPPGNEPPVEDEDEVTTPVGQAPALALLKEAELIDGDGNDTADAGEVIEYTLTATNTGNVALDGVTIDDPMIDALDCTPSQPAALAPDEMLVCTGSYTVTQADVDNSEPVRNVATAASPDPVEPANPPLEDQDEVSTPVTTGDTGPDPIAVPMVEGYRLVLLTLLMLLVGGMAVRMRGAV